MNGIFFDSVDVTQIFDRVQLEDVVMQYKRVIYI